MNEILSSNLGVSFREKTSQDNYKQTEQTQYP